MDPPDATPPARQAPSGEASARPEPSEPAQPPPEDPEPVGEPVQAPDESDPDANVDGPIWVPAVDPSPIPSTASSDEPQPRGHSSGRGELPRVALYGIAIAIVFAALLAIGLLGRGGQERSVSPDASTPASPVGATNSGAELPEGSALPATDTPADAPATAEPSGEGKTVQVKLGDTVHVGLQVPPGYQPWQISSPDPVILQPVEDSATPTTPDMIGVTFRAVGVGQTVIAATSRPACDPGPDCPDIQRRFEENVVVTAD